MNGVIGMASLLSETSLTQQQREYNATILSCGESLLSVINDILDYSKIDSGKMEIEQEEFDLRKCVEDAMDVFSEKAAQSGLALVYRIDDGVPPRIVGDALRLRQVLMNLVSNAVKFTEKGERLSLGVRLDGRNARRGRSSWNFPFGIRASAYRRIRSAFCSNHSRRSIRRLRVNTGEPVWGWPSVRNWCS